jgi:hypothetical protein
MTKLSLKRAEIESELRSVYRTFGPEGFSRLQQILIAEKLNDTTVTDAELIFHCIANKLLRRIAAESFSDRIFRTLTSSRFEATSEMVRHMTLETTISEGAEELIFPS